MGRWVVLHACATGSSGQRPKAAACSKSSCTCLLVLRGVACPNWSEANMQPRKLLLVLESPEWMHLFWGGREGLVLLTPLVHQLCWEQWLQRAEHWGFSWNSGHRTSHCCKKQHWSCRSTILLPNQPRSEFIAFNMCSNLSATGLALHRQGSINEVLPFLAIWDPSM